MLRQKCVFAVLAAGIVSASNLGAPGWGAPKLDAADAPTNFVIILADDLGYGDLACYGHPAIKTPNLDRFANDGMRLTSCYAAAANCSPSRAGLMTGRTPYRVVYADVRGESPVWPTWIWPRFEGKRIRAGRETVK